MISLKRMKEEWLIRYGRENGVPVTSTEVRVFMERYISVFGGDALETRRYLLKWIRKIFSGKSSGFSQRVRKRTHRNYHSGKARAGFSYLC